MSSTGRSCSASRFRADLRINNQPGTETVHNPYPSPLQRHPAYCNRSPSGRSTWQDGFWARFVMLCPPEQERKRGRFLTETRSSDS